MATGYLQTVRENAEKSYQALVDTSARLGAVQEEYRQRQAALEEQQKAGIRSGTSQAAVIGGSLGWQNMKDYYNYANKTGDWGLQRPGASTGTVGGQTGILKTSPEVRAGIETTTPAATEAQNVFSKPTLFNPNETTKLHPATQAEIDLVRAQQDEALLDYYGYPKTPTQGIPTAPQTGQEILKSSGDQLAAIKPVAPTPAAPTSLAPPVGPVETATGDTVNAISGKGISLLKPETTEAAKETTGLLGADTKLAISPEIATDMANIEKTTEAANATTQTGALGNAMSGLGGALGLGLGAYSAAKTGLSVSNVSSMIGGGMMLASWANPAMFTALGPWGIGIGLAGGIAGSIFGW